MFCLDNAFIWFELEILHTESCADKPLELSVMELVLVVIAEASLLAPFIFVYIGDFCFADQLNSTVALLLDIQYLGCYLISDPWIVGTEMHDDNVCMQSANGIQPVISCLPGLWCLFQCLDVSMTLRGVRHLINAGKYSTTFPVVVFATLFAVNVKPGFSLAHLDLNDGGWIIICWLLSTLYTSLVPRPPPFFFFCSSVCVQYNTQKRKTAKNREGLGTLIT